MKRSIGAVSKLSWVVIGWLLCVVAPAAVSAQGTFFVVNGSAGVRTNTPQATLHVQESDSTKHNRVLLRLTGTSFAPQAEYENGSTGVIWRLGVNDSDHFVFNETTDLGVAEMRISPDGRVFVNSTQVHPDYVFSPAYQLRPLDELAEYVHENRHLPGVLTSEEREQQDGIDLTSFPLQLLEKIEELTLYTIEQQEVIGALRESNEELSKRVAALEAQSNR